MSNKYYTFKNNQQKLETAISVSAGDVDAKKIPATGNDGKLHASFMPTGLDISAENIIASEAIAGGKFINIFEDSGIRKVRLADASSNRPAHGFVLAGIASEASGTVYTTGNNTQVSGLTPGVQYFLGTTPGDFSATADLTSGNLIQSLGTAISSTSLRFEFDEPVHVS